MLIEDIDIVNAQPFQADVEPLKKLFGCCPFLIEACGSILGKTYLGGKILGVSWASLNDLSNRLLISTLHIAMSCVQK